MHFTKKNDTQKMSSAFLDRLKMASYCSMTSLERISSKPFRRKMCNTESVPEVYPRFNTDLHSEVDINSGGGDCNDFTQCYSVTTGKVSTLVKAPSFSSLSSIEVAEINNSNGTSTPRYIYDNSSSRYKDSSTHHMNGHAFPQSSSSENVIYLKNSSSSLPPMNRRKTQRYIGPRIMSPLIKTSKIVRTLHNELCSHGINR